MEKEQMLNSILNYLKTDVMTIAKTQCTDEWREYDFTPAYSRMYFILSGEGRVAVGDNEYYPTAGQIVVMPANHNQSYEVISDTPYLKYWMHFNCETGNKSIFDVIEAPCVVSIRSDDIKERIKNIFDAMIAHREAKSYTSNIMLESYIRELIAIYLNQAGIENIRIISSKDNARQSKILKYIDDNIKKKISIDDLSGEVYLHPNYFIKYFKRAFGASPAKYISSRKIEIACQLLRSQEYSVSDISQRLGYTDIYQFSKTFKRHTGFSPSYYRKFIASSPKQTS